MSPKSINLLLVDDNVADRQLVMNTLADGSSETVQFDIETTETLSETIERISNNNYDVILLDSGLTEGSETSAVRAIHNANSNVPIIVLAGLADKQMGLETIRQGAQDCLVKGQLSGEGLIKTIRYAIERKQAEQKYENQTGKWETPLDSATDFFIEHKLEVQKIKNAAKEWRTTFDSITDFISIIDKDFKIRRVNKALANAFGVQPQQLLGRNCYEVFSCTNYRCPNCPHVQTLNTQKTSSAEFYQQQLGMYMEVTTSPIINDDGRIVGSVHIAKDITERKQAEQKLKEHDRLKSEFVATVSHEMRTPLTVFKNIISNALAGVTGPLDPKLRDNLEMADKTIDRLGRIISNFLDISKIETGKIKLNLAHLDIRPVILDATKTLSLLSDEKNIELKTCIPDGELIINADHDGILRVLINLINNAIKFVHQGGHINIQAKGLDETVIVEVEDDGPGIENDDIEKIFGRFVQIEKQVGPGEHGTGLGLSIAKELIEKHGGKIEVQSKPGHGTKFTVFLPWVKQHSHIATSSDDDKTVQETTISV